MRDEGAREQFIDVLAGMVARGGDADIESENAGRRWADELTGIVAEDPVEGSVGFVDGEPVSSHPQNGRRLDVAAAADVFAALRKAKDDFK